MDICLHSGFKVASQDIEIAASRYSRGQNAEGMSYGGSPSFPNYGSTSGTFTSSGSYVSSTMLYNQLCDTVSSNIFAISNNGSALERAAKQLGTPSDNHILRDKIHDMLQRTNDTVNRTTRFLKELSQLLYKAEKEQKLQVDRLRNEFQDTVQRYSNLQKQVAAKMKYTSVVKPHHSTQMLAGEWGSEEGEDEKRSLIDDEQRIQQQKQAVAELEYEQTLYEERDQEVRKIESDMLDINQIMKDLAGMVHEQGETLNTIESNVEGATQNISQGREQLSRASEYQKKARKKMCLLVGILLLVGIVVAVIIYVSVK